MHVARIDASHNTVQWKSLVGRMFSESTPFKCLTEKV